MENMKNYKGKNKHIVGCAFLYIFRKKSNQYCQFSKKKSMN